MELDVAVIGGGQSALSCGYYLRRTDLSFSLFDKNLKPGGSWNHYWESLQLFSPATWSSLPGVLMSGGENHYPTKEEVLEYLSNYEEKYRIPVQRGTTITAIKKAGNYFQLFERNQEITRARYVIDASGTVGQPKTPHVLGINRFKGEQFHSWDYKEPLAFRGKDVLIVGEGNSGAQILAEISQVADNYFWATKKEPRFLPGDVDGRDLFDQATQLYEAKKRGKEFKPPSLGDIVMTPQVQEAFDRGVYQQYGHLERLTEDQVVFTDGKIVYIDAIIWCTGFRSNFDHLNQLIDTDKNGCILVKDNESVDCPGLYFVGHGNWTGFASATLIGVGRTAKKVINSIRDAK